MAVHVARTNKKICEICDPFLRRVNFVSFQVDFFFQEIASLLNTGKLILCPVKTVSLILMSVNAESKCIYIINIKHNRMSSAILSHCFYCQLEIYFNETK